MSSTQTRRSRKPKNRQKRKRGRLSGRSDVVVGGRWKRAGRRMVLGGLEASLGLPEARLHLSLRTNSKARLTAPDSSGLIGDERRRDAYQVVRSIARTG